MPLRDRLTDFRDHLLAVPIEGRIAYVLVAVIAAAAVYVTAQGACSHWRDARSDDTHEEWQTKDAALQQQIDELRGRDKELARQQAEAQAALDAKLDALSAALDADTAQEQRTTNARKTYRQTVRRAPRAGAPVTDAELDRALGPTSDRP